MNWLFELHKTQPIAHAVGVLAFVCVLGMALGSLKFRGIGLGTAGVLFAGILVGHFGEAVDHHTLDFVKEFGLILFVFTIGLQLGPGFFAALRQQGVKMNVLAAAIVILGAVERAAHRLARGFRRRGRARHFFRRLDQYALARRRHADAQHAAGHRARSPRRCPRSLTPSLIRRPSSASSARCCCSSKSSASIPRARPPTSRRRTAARSSRSNAAPSSSRIRTSTACASTRSPAASNRASPSPASATVMKRTPPPTRP